MPKRFAERLLSGTPTFTFRDFVILPAKTEVEPSEVDLRTRFTRNIELAIPFVSSPMDTVTGSEMAIALARLGGVGVIHRNMSVDEQVEEVRRVKRAESFIIRDVVTIGPKATVGDALRVMRERGISGLPVVEGERLVGIVTKRDVSFESPEKLVEEVMTRELHTAEPDVTIEEAKSRMRAHKVEKLPVISREGRLLGLITIKDIYSRERYVNATRDEEGRLRVAASVSPFDIERAKALDAYADALVFDVAHFHNTKAMKAADVVAKETSADIVVGNIGTAEAMKDALRYVRRIDGVRVGIGSGSACITAVITRVAAPTLFAVSQVADALAGEGADIPVIADGGVRNPGDAALALAAGASCIMMGNVFAGCTESPGELIKIGNKYYKPFRGMGSKSSRAKRFSLDRYSHSPKGIAEGVEGFVHYRGDAQAVVEEFSEGLKATMGYTGAKNIRELWERARFGLVSATGVQELSPHDIVLPGD